LATAARANQGIISLFCAFILSLLLRFTEDSFDPDQGPTIGSSFVVLILTLKGVDFKPKIFDVNGNRVKLSIWVRFGCD
jgi:hypothetical protein